MQASLKNGISLTGESATASHVNVADRVQASVTSLVHIKPEVSEPTIPRKRLSDTAFGSATLGEDNAIIPQDKSLSKKIKVETALPKRPFVQVTNPANFPGFDSSAQLSVDESNKLDIINLAIVHQHDLLDRIKPKRVQSNEDRENADKYKPEIDRLHLLKHDHKLTKIKPLPLNMKSENLVKPESGGLKSTADVSTSPMTLVIRKPQPFPMDVDFKPYIRREELSESSSANFQRKESAPVKVAPFSPSHLHLHSLALPAFPLQDAKPCIQHVQPIAPGSKPSMSEPYGPMNVDSEGDGDGHDSDGHDSDFYGYGGMPSVANEVIHKIGIKVPPPIIVDAHDSNGDYYGRGRDLFVGPQAQTNECVP